MLIHALTVASPVGPLTAAATDAGLWAVRFGRTMDAHWRPADRLEVPIVEWLDAYFAGEDARPDVPRGPRGTAFQQAVWDAVAAIPRGQTRTYSEIARAIGKPEAVRAVGAANGANPWPIVVPCHRVIGANGTLTGYAGGLDVKRNLLDREAPALW
jgi:methylated-DNA-[protein]-cysteine S-methyltransferase